MAAAAKACLGSRSDCWKIQEGRIRLVKNNTGEFRLFCRSRRSEFGRIWSQQKQIRGEPVVVNGNAQAVRLEDEEGAGQRRRRLRVAYQGMPGAFSEAAATVVHPGCEGVPCKGYEDAIWAVESGRAERAILPVEGTLEGNVVRNYDLLLHHSLQIVDETQLFVNYCLLAAPGVSKSEIRRVISHPTALAHCSHGLAKVGLDGVTREAVEDTAAAAELIREHRFRDTAAIASCRAAGIYGLDVLARGVQDEPWNVTRFLVLARAAAAAQAGDDPRPWKTSIVIAHEGGLELLMKVLAVFSSHGISLTKLEVRPNGAGNAPLRVLDVDNGGGTVRQFEYVFYIDFDASMANPNAREAVEEVRGFATFVRVLGSYVSDPKIHSFD